MTCHTIENTQQNLSEFRKHWHPTSFKSLNFRRPVLFKVRAPQVVVKHTQVATEGDVEAVSSFSAHFGYQSKRRTSWVTRLVLGFLKAVASFFLAPLPKDWGPTLIQNHEVKSGLTRIHEVCFTGVCVLPKIIGSTAATMQQLCMVWMASFDFLVWIGYGYIIYVI